MLRFRSHLVAAGLVAAGLMGAAVAMGAEAEATAKEVVTAVQLSTEKAWHGEKGAWSGHNLHACRGINCGRARWLSLT